MDRARVAFLFLAVGAGCYTTPRTSWPDADFSTGGNGGGGSAGVTGSGGSGGGLACSPACAATAYCDNGACKSRVTEFTLQDVGAKPRNIVAGADGNLWFTDASYDKIRRITASGTINEFIVPTTGSRLGAI